jgi:nicotinate-nucleotide adenylyltransferase
MAVVVKRGVFGGTFDPVHLGHLLIAEYVRRKLALDEVIFIPAGNPWLKTNRSISEATHRMAMVSMAIAGKPYFSLSAIEVNRPGPSYTVDTMAEFQKSGGELYFILGSDNLLALPSWYKPLDLIRLCTLVSVPRFGGSAINMCAIEKALPGISNRVIILDRPLVDISSTGVRKRVASLRPIDHLVPGEVEAYIKAKGLYS